MSSRLAASALLLMGTAASCAALPQPDGERALARAERQVEAGPRIPGTPGHRVIGDWIAAECESLGATVERDRFADSTLGRRLDLENLIAHVGPHTGRRITLMAHWDTRPESDQDPDPAHRHDPVPGANDAASGVVVLLEVAEAARRAPLPVGVDLVFLDGEDQGRASDPEEFCLGARRYAATLTAAPPEQRPIAAFLFDMVGDRDLGIWPEVESSQRATNLVALVLEAARATGARSFHSTPRHDVTDDHIPLLDAGIPAVDIIDFDYAAWHTHRDLPDQISTASLAEVSRVAIWLVYKSPLARSSAAGSR
jgi:acetylornithine deacetylase/succinyl-diaminopimelate desuccinylase-like protein